MCRAAPPDEALLSPPVALRSTDAADAVASFHLRAPWLQDGLSSAAPLLPVATGDRSTTIKSVGNRGSFTMLNSSLPRWYCFLSDCFNLLCIFSCRDVYCEIQTAAGISLLVCRTQLGLNVLVSCFCLKAAGLILLS